MNRTRRFFGVVFGVLLCFLTGNVVRHVVHGQVPQVHLERLGPQKGRLKENPDGQDFHWASQAARAESSPRGELGFVEALFFARGDGHGADVTGFVIFQSSYSDAALGNVVRLIWTENTTNNPAGVTVAIDGTVLGTAPGLADADLPGLNAVRVTNVPPGDHHFTISGGGTMAEADQLVLASQPFADPSGLQCKSGGRDSANGACDIAMTWSQPQVEPQGILIFVNGTFQVRVFGAVRNFTLTGEPPGSYTVALRGVLDNADGNYLGAAVVQSTCDIACDDLPCDAPGLLFLCQSAYGPAAENAVNADWRNGEISYGGINTLTDGTVVGTFPGDSTSVRFGGLLPGQHTFGVQGDCGAPAGQSAITDGTLTLLTESPHKNPVQGDIVCTFNGGDPPSTTIT